MNALTAATCVTRLLGPIALGVGVLALFADQTARALPGVQDVNVVNTPTVSVGNVPNVNVVNAVRLAERTIVGVEVSPTVTLADQFIQNGEVGPFDVSRFRQIRVVVMSQVNGSCWFRIDTPIVGPSVPYASLQPPVALGPGDVFTAVYDVPGDFVVLRSNCPLGLKLFGRTN